MMKQIPASHQDLIDGPYVVALSTVMPDGQPQTTPVWCNRHEGFILVNVMKGFRKEKVSANKRWVNLKCGEAPGAAARIGPRLGSASACAGLCVQRACPSSTAVSQLHGMPRAVCRRATSRALACATCPRPRYWCAIRRGRSFGIGAWPAWR